MATQTKSEVPDRIAAQALKELPTHCRSLAALYCIHRISQPWWRQNFLTIEITDAGREALRQYRQQVKE